jgi:hypothetical protein
VIACTGAGAAFAQTPDTTSTNLTPPLRISGVVELEDQDELRTAAVTITRTDGNGGTLGPALAARMYPDGAFFFVNVIPGRYHLRASAQSYDDDRSMYATQDITVETAPITNLHLILRQPAPPVQAPPGPTSFLR